MTDSSLPNAKTSSKAIYPWHNSCWDNFTKAAKQNHLPHAILLSGEEGIGKLELAQRMAQALLCIKSDSGVLDACQQCPSCKTYHSAANPDFIQIGLLEDKKQIGVDQIRALSEFLNYSRSYNTYRVVIINPVERMNINAANSLLKSLEEPTANTIIILVTAKSSELLATIRSRCQLINVSSPNKEETMAWLTQHHNSNNNSNNNQNDTNIDAEKLFTMVGNKPLMASQISQEDFDNKQLFIVELLAVIHGNTSINEMAKKWEKHDFGVLLDWQLQIIQYSIKSSVTNNLSSNDINHLQSYMADHYSDGEKWVLYQQLIKQKQYIHTSVNTLMFMENMIMLWSKASN